MAPIGRVGLIPYPPRNGRTQASQQPFWQGSIQKEKVVSQSRTSAPTGWLLSVWSYHLGRHRRKSHARSRPRHTRRRTVSIEVGSSTSPTPSSSRPRHCGHLWTQMREPWLSQSGPWARVPLHCFPTSHATRIDSEIFRTLLLRRPVALPLNARVCRCGRLLDCLGHHRSACAVSDALGRRGFAVEVAVARICRDLDSSQVPGVDGRRLEVVAEGLEAPNLRLTRRWSAQCVAGKARCRRGWWTVVSRRSQLFFFEKENEENQKVAVRRARKKKKSLITSPYKPSQASAPDGGVPSTPLSSKDRAKRELRNKPSTCSICGASSSRCSPDGPRLRPGFGPCETCDEEASFIRQASADFTRQHDKTWATMLACQLWIGQLFAPSSLRQRGSINGVALAAGVGPRCYCQQRPMEQWQSVSNDPDPSIVRSPQGKQIQIVNSDIRRLELQPRGTPERSRSARTTLSGQQVKGSPAMGPPVNVTKPSLTNLGHTTPAKKEASTSCAATRCHPWRGAPGPGASSTPRCPGRNPLDKSPHSGASKPASCKRR